MLPITSFYLLQLKKLELIWQRSRVWWETENEGDTASYTHIYLFCVNFLQALIPILFLYLIKKETLILINKCSLNVFSQFLSIF